jgi:hypothetical protein
MQTTVDRFFAIWCVIWLAWFAVFLIPASLGHFVIATVIGMVSFIMLWMVFCDGMAGLKID